MEKSQVQTIIVFGIDDDRIDLESLHRALNGIRAWNIEFYPFSDWHQCRVEINRSPMDVLFVDFNLGALTGLDIVKELRTSGEKRPIIVLTGQGSEKIASEITRAGADDYLIKDDLTPDTLRRSIKSVLERFKAGEEKALLEKQLQEAQKMETLGTLAGGIAHDFNNLLTSIMGYADFAKMKSKGREVESDLDTIISTCRQMAELVKQLLSFSRKDENRISILDLGMVISDAVNILKHTLPKSIKLKIDTPQKPVCIKSNANLLSQIILNLCINASDAMPEGGEVQIKYRYVEVGSAYLLSHPQLSPGGHVLLEIEDSGHGMTEETKQRIFEPFFTTKTLGAQKGTGLGLSIVWNNVKKLKGVVDIDSEVDKGTVFKIYFPSGEQECSIYEPADVENVIGKKETVLIIDDEAIVLKLVSRMLTRLNYNVYRASNGIEALDIFREMHSEIDLVISDISMPEMDGKTCIKELRKLDSDIKVLFSSGHDLTGEAEELKALGCSGLIQKPYSMTDLGIRINKVLCEADNQVLSEEN